MTDIQGFTLKIAGDQAMSKRKTPAPGERGRDYVEFKDYIFFTANDSDGGTERDDRVIATGSVPARLLGKSNESDI